MSKASEWARQMIALKPPRFVARSARGTVSVTGDVESDGMCWITRTLPGNDTTMAIDPDTAVALARWILSTFGEQTT
jgi:hypothetical protein